MLQKYELFFSNQTILLVNFKKRKKCKNKQRFCKMFFFRIVKHHIMRLSNYLAKSGSSTERVEYGSI